MATPFTSEKLRRRAFGQLWQLALQLLLGMAVNLLGADAKGGLRVLMITILLLHIVNGIGLLEGNIYIGLKEQTKLSWWAFVATMVALTAGVLTVSLKATTDIWSFVMALGFVASAWLNGMLYVRADRKARG